MIRIITGWGNPGGSSVALSNLCNGFNERGHECILYAPHDWILTKCKSEKLYSRKLKLQTSDVLIFHFWIMNHRPPAKKVILACHEKWWFEVGKLYQYWDTLVFLHKEHQLYHNQYKGNYVIIPNLKENLIKINKKELDKVAGIIGTIEDRKQTHISIQRALKDSCEKILLFGKIGDQTYFNTNIKQFLGDTIIYKGFQENKQNIYNSIGRVYHSSKGEVASLVKDECYTTATKFYGCTETESEIDMTTNEDIINKWITLIQG
jgi:hypothetical protein